MLQNSTFCCGTILFESETDVETADADANGTFISAAAPIIGGRKEGADSSEARSPGGAVAL